MEALFNVAQGFGLMLIVMGLALLLGMLVVLGVICLVALGERIEALVARVLK